MSGSHIACDDLKERLVALEKSLSDPWSDCYVERLLDVVIAAVNDLRLAPKSKENDHLLMFCKRFADVAAQLQSHRRQPQDFHPIASLGHGAFGRVQLVREVTTGRVCAMKVLKKSRMLTQHTDYWTEREIMARGDSPWIVQLYYAFQDLTSLYMVMEFVPGGNLVGWMEDVEVISEATCRFYAAETVLALADLHAMGFIHRDLKPDNLLLDAGGHVKLADFGTAVRVDPDTHLIHCEAAVGTPDYLSPEVLLSQGGGGGSYGFEVDWWALGVLVYEMLYGDTPFYSETLVHTYAKIMSHANHLKFPDNIYVSESGLDFIKQLLRDRESRLGSGTDGSEEVTNHAWFSPEWAESQKASGSLEPTDLSIMDWSWSNIRACRAPFQPQLTCETDTSYFQPDTDEEDQVPSDDSPLNKQPARLDEATTYTENTAMGAREPKSSAMTETSLFLSKFPAVQLAFAGFSFSSPHPNHLALLNGLHLTPHVPSSLLLSAPEATASIMNGTASIDEVEPECDRHLPTAGAAPSPSTALQSATSDGAAVSDTQEVLKAQLAQVRAQLDDALALAEMHSNEVIELTERLEKVVSHRRDLEMKLTQRDVLHRTAVEEAQQRLEHVQAEAAANLACLEAEVAKWKSFAQSEQTARESAEAAGSIAVATATARLAKRAAELADRVAGPRGTTFRSSNHLGPSSLSTANEMGSDQSDCDWLPPPGAATALSIDTQTVATNLLLSRVEEMARRAHRAEAAAREAADMLEAEQHFSRLYKETSAEKSDQLKESNREMDEVRELLSASQKDCRRCHEECEAARRALTEEQQRSLRFREAAQIADESALSASRRAALARREAADLRESLEQMKQALETEKIKCAAAVDKLTEIMTGANTDALEIMYMASAQAKDAGSGGGFYLGSMANRHKLAAILGNRQQQQLNQQSREIKRLQNEIKRLNAELASSKRESQSVATGLERSRVRDDARLPGVSHSRENSDDLVARATNVQMRQRSGFFGRTRGAPQSGDSGLGSERGSTLKSLATEQSAPQVVPSSELQMQRHNSLGERSLRAVIPLSITPNHVGEQQSVCSPVASIPFDPTAFLMASLLHMGVRQQRRKKLAWCPRVVKLTPTHLIVWDCSPETMAFLDMDQSDSIVDSSTGVRIHRGFCPTPSAIVPALEIPLTALYRVRQIDPSEANHEPPEFLTLAFHVAYDRSVSDVPVKMMVATTPTTPGQHTTMTLPRKFSFGSSAVFSTTNSSASSQNRRHQALDPVSMTKRSHLESCIDQANSVSPNAPSPKPSVMPHLLVIRGHQLQSIRFPRMAVCDLCRKPSWQWAHPPPAFQCIHCQLKFHANHLETLDYVLPDCGKAVVSCLFRCQSKWEQEKWIASISMAMQYASSNAQHGHLNASSHTKTLSALDRVMTTDPLPDLSPSPSAIGQGGTEILVYSPSAHSHVDYVPSSSVDRPPIDPLLTSPRDLAYDETGTTDTAIQRGDSDRVIVTDPPTVRENDNWSKTNALRDSNTASHEIT